jgi:peptide/nickel transport system substrate-binding protein
VIAPGNSHLVVQGQQDYLPAPTGSATTTIPPSTSSTSTTTIGAGGSVNFPVTPVPAQAATFIVATGLERTPGDAYYHWSFGAPFQLHMVYDSSDPWATAAAPVIQSELQAAGLDATLLPVAGATQTGETLAAGFADLAVLPQTFTPYMSQAVAMYTQLLGPTGKNGSQDWTGYSDNKFDQLVTTASKQLNLTTAMGLYAQADTMLWDNMVSLPLFAEPTVLVWSRTIAGVNAEPRSTSLLWFAQYWAVKVPESTSNTTPSLPGP